MEDYRSEVGDSRYGFHQWDDHTAHIIENEDNNLPFQCIDENYKLRGNYNSEVANNLMIVFQRCGVEVEEGENHACATDSQIDQTIEGSYILLIENYEAYDHNVNPSWGDVISKKTHIYWYTLSSVVAQDYQKLISFTSVEYNKQNIGLNLYQ